MPQKYFLIDKPNLLIILNTWSNTEKPPKPSKKLQAVILIEISFKGMLATSLTPFVNSTIPDKIGVINWVGIWKAEKIGAIVIEASSNKWLWFKIEIITENRTTNPPINKIVEIEFIILLPSTSPSEEKLTFSAEDKEVLVWENEELV